MLRWIGWASKKIYVHFCEGSRCLSLEEIQMTPTSHGRGMGVYLDTYDIDCASQIGTMSGKSKKNSASKKR